MNRATKGGVRQEVGVRGLVRLAAVALAAGFLVAVPSAVGADTITGSTTVAFSSNPVILGPGDDVTITTTTTAAPHSDPPAAEIIDEGKVTIQYLALAGVPVPAGTAGADWVSLNSPGQSPVNGETSYSLDLDAYGFLPGTVGAFRAHYVTGGGAHKVDTHNSPAVDLTVASEGECEGTLIGAALASGAGSPAPGSGLQSWAFRIAVQNCTGATRTYKVQGGTNGWAPLTGVLPSSGITEVKENKRSQVIIWTVTIPDGGTATLDVTVQGTIHDGMTDGQVLYLSGAWSAAWNDNGPQKSEYTGRVSITVEEP